MFKNNTYLGTANCENFRVKRRSFRGYFSEAFAELVYGHVYVFMYVLYVCACIYIYIYIYIYT